MNTKELKKNTKPRPTSERFVRPTVFVRAGSRTHLPAIFVRCELDLKNNNNLQSAFNYYYMEVDSL